MVAVVVIVVMIMVLLLLLLFSLRDISGNVGGSLIECHCGGIVSFLFVDGGRLLLMNCVAFTRLGRRRRHCRRRGRRGVRVATERAAAALFRVGGRNERERRRIIQSRIEFILEL